MPVMRLQEDAIALGTGADAKIADSVAIGTGSITTGAAGVAVGKGTNRRS